MQGDQGNWPNKRRYPRLIIPARQGDLNKLVGISAQVPSGEKIPVLDVSFNGVAILRQGAQDLEKIGTRLPLQFHFDNNILKPIATEVVRTSETAIGMRFSEMTPETRLEFDKYLSDKMLGHNTHRVRPELLNAHDRSQDLSFWYHGPKDTNIFIWRVGEEVIKFIIELDYQVIEFDRGEINYTSSLPETEFFRRGYSAYQDVRGTTNVVFSASDVLRRAISFLSHISDKGKEIDWIINFLLARASNG